MVGHGADPAWSDSCLREDICRNSCSRPESRTAIPQSQCEGQDDRSDEMEKTQSLPALARGFRARQGNGARAICATGRPTIGRTPGPGRYDWSSRTKPLPRCTSMDIEPIADLCHFGVPDWIGDFQNPDWPELFAEYARAFARRFPWVRFYTPVNEIYIAATFSAQYGWWNERLTVGPRIRHRAEASVPGQRAGDARDSRGAAGRDLHPERIDANTSMPEDPECQELARRSQSQALPLAGPLLRAPRRRHHVRVPAGQRHDARGVPLVLDSIT